jgi:hypothetical protein
MNQSSSSSSSSFQPLFNSALQDYADQTGIKLNEHVLIKQLENCDSIDSICSILQEHAQRFHAFRGEDGKIVKSLKSVINVLYTLSTSTVLGEGVGMVRPKLLVFVSLLSMYIPQPFPPAKTVFAAFAILLAVRLFHYSHTYIFVISGNPRP